MRMALAATLIALAVGIVGCSDSAMPQQLRAPQQAVQSSQPAQTAQAEQRATSQADAQESKAVQAQPEQPDPPEQPTRPAQSQQQDEEVAQTRQAQRRADLAVDQPHSQEAALDTVPDGTRIVSLFGDVTEILYALGVEDYIVGVDVSSVFPEAAQDLPDVGFAGALNAEGILALNPSIVIGGSTVAPGPPGVIDQLEQAGIEVLVLPELIGLDAPAIKIRAIGAALEIPRTAEALAQRVEAEIEAARPKSAAADTEPLSVLFVYLRRGGIQLVSGAGREAETIITAAGGIDAGAAAGIGGWESLSPEALLAIDPDVYLVMELGYDAVGGLEGLLEIPGMAQTEAGRHQRVIVMEDILLLGFGPRMAASIVQLRDFLAGVQASLQDSSESAQ